MKQVYCFGNEFVEGDSLAKQIADKLKIEGFEFIKCDSPDILLDKKDILIMDVVKGIKKPIVIEDINQLKEKRLCSLHDFDLGFFLQLLNEIGKLGKIKIIGIPQEGNEEEIIEKIKEILKPT